MLPRWSYLIPCLIVELLFSTISFDTPKCPFGDSTSETTNKFRFIVDDAEDTCDFLSGYGSPYIEVVWTFPLHPSSTNQFRMTSFGSQSCKDWNVTWFVRCKDSMTECSAEEELNDGSRICNVTCKKVCKTDVGYLHFRVQFLSNKNGPLALCHNVMTTVFKIVKPQLRII